jgi:alcohol dehydrogenase class IV
VKLILDYSSQAINIKNKKALQSISAAAHLSGKSINITKTTAPHAISYILTSNFNIAHGHAVGIMVAPIAYISYLKNDSNFNKSLQVIYKLFDCDSIYGFIEKWKKIMTHFGLAYKLEDLGVVKNDVDMIVSNINIERLNNHPVNLTNKDLIKAINISISGFINHV